MKVICYSLFGYDRPRHESCFDFNSYLRSLMISIRMNRLIYPDWRINLQTDEATYKAFEPLLSKLDIDIEIHQNGVPLTLAMLWRLRPIFYTKPDGTWANTHVLCRDLDSPCTYREAQAVKYWINKDKSMHAITDSISHCLPLLGGMIGIRPAYFTEKMNVRSWRDLINLKNNYNWERKGADQDFLNEIVYPKFAQHGNDSITQHYILGMPNTFLSDYHNKIQDLELDIPVSLKESNDTCGHIGAAGFYEAAMFKFLRKHWDKYNDLIELEKQYPSIFYWVNE